MFKYILLLLLFSISLFSATKAVPLMEKYSTSKNCVACHAPIVEEWRKSWHYKSHIDKDEYLKKSIDYIARKSRGETFEMIEIQCANCHNPRISITSISDDDKMRKLMDIDNNKLKKATNDKKLTEGINCMVCHNIDKIHDNKPENIRGMQRVTWMKSGIMSGPYNDAKSPYHKVKSRDFMNKNPNQLCFVCHANKRTIQGVKIVDMKEQYENASSPKKLCVDCHMSAPYKGVASTYKIDGGHAKKRVVRRHSFNGAHKRDMVKNSLKMKLKKNGNILEVKLINDIPHNVPSGMGGREILIVVSYNGGKKDKLSLTSHFVNKRDKISIPTCADKIVDDNSIPATSSKTFEFNIPDGSRHAEVHVYFKLVNDEIIETLNLKDRIWSKKMLIVAKRLKFQK